MEDLTVVIPVFNRRSLVLDALNSIAKQTLQPASVTIVDDGSTDGTYDSVRSWIHQQRSSAGENTATFQLLKQTNENAATARANGMAATKKTEYVSFLDSDDIWPADLIERSVETMKQHPKAVAASTDRIFLDSDEREIQRDDCSELAKSPLQWLFRHGAGVASCSMFRWDAVMEAGGWDPRYHLAEDTVLFSQICTQGEWVHVSGAPVTFRVGNRSELGEEGNLSRKFADRFEHWAITHEKIYEKLASYVSGADKKCMRLQIGNFWYRAGKRHQSCAEYDPAAECFRKALHWDRYFVRARIRLFNMTTFSR
jgi:glycosyltransferase involved in cell wall biosynthesis